MLILPSAPNRTPDPLDYPAGRMGKEQKMDTQQNLERRSFLRAVFGCAALIGLMTLSASAPAKADDDFQRRIVKADHELHEAAEHHGWTSKQAAHWRHELQEAREYCWKHNHRWWDEDDRRWHADRDWDDHDHDDAHDRDRRPDDHPHP